ncbi:MAG TPA: hypothetical protein VJ835_08045 [Fimbriimonadaceae bacterium]|nr:hypothetical protein [Fimbriimonadaceae bacterium]
MRGRGEQVLKKLAWALAAASFVVVGCGGGGGGGGGGTVPPPPTDGSFVKLPNNPGQVAFSYLTGAGRAPGDMTAIIRRAVLTDNFGSVETILNPERSLLLNGYTHQIINLSVPTTSSRFFTTYTLEVKELRVDNGSPFPDIFPSGGSQPLVQEDFPASIRVLPGRVTSVAVRLDDTMFDINAGNPEDIFQRFVFEDANLVENLVQGTPTLNGFLSDYVMFDLSGIPSGDRPELSNGDPAGKVYFSGDFAALSEGGSSGRFEVLTALGFVDGTFAPVLDLPSPGGNKPRFGTYTLLQSDPRDDDPSDDDFPGPDVHQINALEGTYYNLADVVGNLGDFEMITFPRSQEREVFDAQSNQNVLRELSEQDVILIERSGNTITQIYFGQIDFGQNQGDPTTIRAYPIGQIDTGDAFNEIEGTVSDFKSVNGTPINLDVLSGASRATAIQSIGSGTFTLQDGTDPVYGGTLPASFPTTGRFLVFRR